LGGGASNLDSYRKFGVGMNMRKIPIYIAIDCGENMHSLYPVVKNTLTLFIEHEKHDPTSLESMWMCFIAVGSTFKVVKPLRPLEEIHGINIKPIKGQANTNTFEAEMVRLFTYDLINRRTEVLRPDYRPRIFWISDGTHREFVKKCLNPYHWKRSGWLAYFVEIDCSIEGVASRFVESDFWICNPYDDELMLDEDEYLYL
jgi:uncharacterized protein YegL